VNLKDVKFGHWMYAGFGEDEIYFAVPDYQDKKSGWTLRSFSSKAQLKESIFLESSISFTQTNWNSTGSTGGYYLNRSEFSSGKVFFNKGSYYMLGIQGSQLESYVLKNGKWNKIQGTEVSPVNEKKGFSFITAMMLNEGVACNVKGKMFLLPLSGSIVQNKANDRTPFNPSSYCISNPKESFAVSLANTNLFLNPTQLNKAGEIKFELVKK